MRKFDTRVQHMKYQVLREVAKEAYAGTLTENLLEIPKRIIPGKTPSMRCCVYKERAVIGERIKMAMGGDKSNPNVIEVIDIACEECPGGGYAVTDSCRGCLAHRCADACKFGAITFDEHHTAHIDKSKCVNCGACAKVCPYSAIANRKRPCQIACKVNAVKTAEDGIAAIDNDKCISCGACVYQCPFGAISDKSYILDAIEILKNSHDNKDYRVYAVVAPSIASQFKYAKLGQVFTGLYRMGFYAIAEAALGADMVAKAESKELAEKGFLISSCCPAFVSYVQKAFPKLVPFVSENISPMAAISAYLKSQDPDCKVIFIGPCTAKKGEIKKETVRDFVDVALTFEELQALFDSREIDITTLEESTLDSASYFGRIFGRCGGLSDAVLEGLKEQGLEDFPLKPATCDGIDDCRVALLKKSKNVLDANFIEGMACLGGCVGGAGCLTHGEKNKVDVEKYGLLATRSITDAVNALDDK
ncbi:MAG: 4Fe-4S dicluster domain-containing protein [Clostridia bacterium]|nr:4Fe-4S dicluster domain-containing protein [Clostridia bacterium]